MSRGGRSRQCPDAATAYPPALPLCGVSKKKWKQTQPDQRFSAPPPPNHARSQLFDRAVDLSVSVFLKITDSTDGEVKLSLQNRAFWNENPYAHRTRASIGGRMNNMCIRFYIVSKGFAACQVVFSSWRAGCPFPPSFEVNRERK